MNGRNPPCNPQEDDRQLYEVLAWRNRRADAADAVNFDDWLDSPEGIAWIEGEAEGEAERAGHSQYAASAVIWH